MNKVFSLTNDIDLSVWVTGLNHLLGVEINDYSKSIFDNKFNRNFGYIDQVNIDYGSLSLSVLKFIDENGYALDYLEYMRKYYPDQEMIAEVQYAIYG